MLRAVISIQTAYLFVQEQGSFDRKSGKKCAKEEKESVHHNVY